MTNFKATPFDWNIVATVSKLNPPLLFPANTDDLKENLQNDSKLQTLANEPLDLIACWNYYWTKIADHNRYQHFSFFSSFVFSLGFSLTDFAKACSEKYDQDNTFFAFAGSVILQNNIHLSPAAGLLSLKNDLSAPAYKTIFQQAKDKLTLNDDAIFNTTGVMDAVHQFKEAQRQQRQSRY